MQTAHVIDRFNESSPSIVVHETESPTTEARLAMALVEKWGMVSGAPDGEDSQGRSRMKLLAPAEVVSRACETAELMISELRKRKWFTEVPSWDDAKKQARAARKRGEDEEEDARVAAAARRAERSKTRYDDRGPL